ncbi:MAG: PD-(D/E)XK nuclease family protein [Desulfovermiculus sp.]|nr:PD-(D/E)XK nuclease family protein [Desulfovermiculus sp.]
MGLHIPLEVKTIVPCTKPKWLSPTAINTYLKCPRKFYLKKIAKRKEKPSIHLIRGIAVHGAIEKFYECNLNRCAHLGFDEIIHALKVFLEEEWERQHYDLEELDLKAVDIEFFKHESQQMLKNFLDSFVQEGGFEKSKPMIEKTLFSRPKRLLARVDKIDRFQRPHLITDFKTSKSMEVTDDLRRQMGISALLYEEVYQTRPRVALHFLKFEKGLRFFQVGDALIQEMKQLVEDVHLATVSGNSKDYPCACGWCHHNFKENGEDR